MSWFEDTLPKYDVYKDFFSDIDPLKIQYGQLDYDISEGAYIDIQVGTTETNSSDRESKINGTYSN